MSVRKRRPNGCLIDLLLYTAIGLGVVAFAAIYALHAVRTGGNGQLPLKWIGLAGQTGVVFGYVGRAMRSYWKNRRFWAGYLGFFAAHLVAYVVVLLRVERFPLLWFVVIGYIEWVALAYLLELVLRDDS
jgi:hypothetical protein